jgi:hypothetical protein
MLRFGRRRWTRLLALGVAVLLALLYYRPVRTYLNTPRHAPGPHSGGPRSRGAEAPAGDAPDRDRAGGVARRGARRLGLVKPGEHLFIVQGISEWRRAHARK